MVAESEEAPEASVLATDPEAGDRVGACFLRVAEFEVQAAEGEMRVGLGVELEDVVEVGDRLGRETGLSAYQCAVEMQFWHRD